MYVLTSNISTVLLSTTLNSNMAANESTMFTARRWNLTLERRVSSEQDTSTLHTVSDHMISHVIQLILDTLCSDYDM